MKRAIQHVWVVVLIMLLGACGTSAPAATTAPTVAPLPTVAPEASAAATAQAAPTVNRAEGRPDAPVKVIAYSDFQCPYCASFARETMPEVVKNYVDTGNVYFEFRDFPLSQIHGSAVLAAHAANCAAEQGQFFPMHDRLFAGQAASEWGNDLSSDFSTFLGYARELKLDDTALQRCVQSQQFRAQIESDFRAGRKAGIESTPSFVVNGELLVGAQPYDVWRKTLDAAIAKAAK